MDRDVPPPLVVVLLLGPPQTPAATVETPTKRGSHLPLEPGGPEGPEDTRPVSSLQSGLRARRPMPTGPTVPTPLPTTSVSCTPWTPVASQDIDPWSCPGGGHTGGSSSRQTPRHNHSDTRLCVTLFANSLGPSFTPRLQTSVFLSGSPKGPWNTHPTQ